MPPSERIEIGLRFWSLVWLNVAERVIDTACKVYELEPEQQAALRKAFLRAGDYRAVLPKE
jgi:hypothetical protein